MCDERKESQRLQQALLLHAQRYHPQLRRNAPTRIGNSPPTSDTFLVCIPTDGSVTIRTCCRFVRDDGGTRSESTVGGTSEGGTAHPYNTNSDVDVDV